MRRVKLNRLVLQKTRPEIDLYPEQHVWTVSNRRYESLECSSRRLLPRFTVYHILPEVEFKSRCEKKLLQQAEKQGLYLTSLSAELTCPQLPYLFSFWVIFFVSVMLMFELCVYGNHAQLVFAIILRNVKYQGNKEMKWIKLKIQGAKQSFKRKKKAWRTNTQKAAVVSWILCPQLPSLP